MAYWEHRTLSSKSVNILPNNTVNWWLIAPVEGVFTSYCSYFSMKTNGYSLETPCQGASNEDHNMFSWRNKKKISLHFGWKRCLILSYVMSIAYLYNINICQTESLQALVNTSYYPFSSEVKHFRNFRQISSHFCSKVVGLSWNVLKTLAKKQFMLSFIMLITTS